MAARRLFEGASVSRVDGRLTNAGGETGLKQGAKHGKAGALRAAATLRRLGWPVFILFSQQI